MNDQFRLALDLGTRTGWAISKKDTFGTHKIIKSGSVNFMGGRFSGGGIRFLKFQQFIENLFCEYKFELIFFEEVRRHLGVDAAHIYGGFWGAISAWAEKNEIAYEGVPVGTIKKYITGRGNASKIDVINAVRKLGFFPIDDNEADAISILCFKNNIYKHSL